MKKNKIIFLTYQPLTKFISKRHGVKIKKKNWEKQYWNILPLINNKLYKKYKKDGFRNIEDENFYTIDNFQLLVQKLNELNGDFFYINSARGLLFSHFIEIFFKIKKGKKIEIHHGYMLGETENYYDSLKELIKFDLFFGIKKIFYSILNKIKTILVYFLYVNPDFYFCGNQLTFDRISENKKKFRINSFDYNFYLVNKEFKTQRSNKIVFIDSAIENSFENQLLGLVKNQFSKEKYWDSMLNIFQKIESQNTNSQIEVAAHMRRNIFDTPIKRNFIFDKTLELIKNSNLVISHNSLSIQWAILFKKPIILVYVENFKYLALSNTKEINNLSEILGLKKIIVDKNFNVNMNNISLNDLKVDDNKYNNFIKKYINFENLNEIPEDPYLTVLKKLENLN